MFLSRFLKRPQEVVMPTVEAIPSMTLGPDGKQLMHYYEGCRLKAYPDPATGGHPWTIGYGDTGPDVVPGLVITQAQAEERFDRRLSKEFEPALNNLITQPVTQRQFDAMLSLAYNIGIGNFRTSTLLRKFNEGDFTAASLQFPAWNRANMKPMLGLVRRRDAERTVFNGAPATLAIEKAKTIMAV